MKAAYHTQYGSPEVLTIRETAKPVPKAHQILVKVLATTVNRTDCGIIRAKPFIIRIFTGLIHPALPTTGTDFAGVVEAIGKNVSRFRPGDRVWGLDDMGLSSHAEYLVISENKAVLTIPEGISFEQAAAGSEGAHYALNFINKIKLAPGQKVLVNGATGAIGSAAVQLLKYYEIHVSAVCRGEHFKQVKSLGADQLIDYTREDFTRRAEQYDYIFDAVGKSSFFRCKRLLNSKGAYISSELGPWSQNLYMPLITKIAGGKKVIFPFPQNIKNSLEFVKELMEQGRFKPLIDREFPLEKIREAFTYVASGQKTGNVILKMV